jgi:two-component system cell cycle response regulator DivK
MAKAKKNKARILSVEDNAPLAQVMRTFLESQDFDVLEAADGEAAVRMAEETRPDLILMDVQLPLLSGFEATRRIRQKFALASIPIIAVTGFAMEQDAASAYAVGCNAYITKPYDMDELLATIQRLLK